MDSSLLLVREIQLLEEYLSQSPWLLVFRETLEKEVSCHVSSTCTTTDITHQEETSCWKNSLEQYDWDLLEVIDQHPYLLHHSKTRLKDWIIESKLHMKELMKQHLFLLLSELEEQHHFRVVSEEEKRRWCDEMMACFFHAWKEMRQFIFSRLSQTRMQSSKPTAMNSKHILLDWLLAHAFAPYPSEKEKKRLAEMTGMTVNQVNNWFINARMRTWKPVLEQVKKQLGYLSQSRHIFYKK